MKTLVVLAVVTAHGRASSQTSVAVEPLSYRLGYRIVDGEMNSGGNYEAMEMVVSAITETVRIFERHSLWLVMVQQFVA